MLRLILKEIRSSCWFIGLACLGAIAFTLFRDPFGFLGDQSDESSAFFMLFFLVLGLRSYSGELKDATIGFLYSRPIKWWQILIAKLIAGVMGITLVLLVASLTYVLSAPDQYRPFIADGLARGIQFGFGICGTAYAIGFVVSVLMPGMALAFASFLVVLIVLFLPFITADTIGKESFAIIGGANAGILVGLGAFVSTILVARRLPKLGMKERWLVWAKLPAMGMALAYLLATVHFNISAECLPNMKACALSPNGQWALYSTFPDAVYRKGRLVLVDTRTGRELWSTSEKMVSVYPQTPVCAWADDSSKFAYVTTDSKAKIVSMGKKPSIVWTAKISSLKEDPEGWLNTHILWKPDGGKLAILFSSHVRNSQSRTGMEDKYLLDVLDIRDRKVLTSDHKPAILKSAEALSADSNQPVYTNFEELFWPPGFGESAAQ